MKEEQRNELLKLLQKVDGFFCGTLSTCKIDPVEFELKYSSNTICSIPYPVLKVRK